jgi:hypothetical protein
VYRRQLESCYSIYSTLGGTSVGFAAAAQFNDSLVDLGRAAADNPASPHYLDSSFFKRFENPK